MSYYFTPIRMAIIFFNARFLLFFFWSCHVACEILVPQPGIKPVPPAVKARSPNHWTTREFP